MEMKILDTETFNAKMQELITAVYNTKNVNVTSIKYVTSLPSDADDHTVYLLKAEDGLFDQYIYQDSSFYNIGRVEIKNVSLEGYVTTDEYNSKVTSLEERISALESALSEYVKTADLPTDIATKADITSESTTLKAMMKGYRDGLLGNASDEYNTLGKIENILKTNN